MIVKEWLDAEFEGERHANRVKMDMKQENERQKEHIKQGAFVENSVYNDFSRTNLAPKVFII